MSYAIFCFKTQTNVTVTDPLTGNFLSTAERLAVVAGLHFASLTHTFFFFNDTATTEIYTLSLHDALPIWPVTSSVSTPIDYSPGLKIVKTVESVTDGNSTALTDAGDVIHYDVLVTNTGDVTLTNVTVTDPLTGN